jgi:hypothetical protein
MSYVKYEDKPKLAILIGPKRSDGDIPTLVPSSPLNDDQTIAAKKDSTDDIRIGPITRARAKLQEQ